MIEQIKYKNKLYALIARKGFRKKNGIREVKNCIGS